LLSQNLINQIAAGEVIERPSSVIKELMENSIDAGASEISVGIINAGKSLISIEDNGIGMDKESLEMCLKSHATSKLTSENLFDIHTFGFRGEALPSIASISRLSISSAQELSEQAWCIRLEGQNILGTVPIIRKRGTTVEMRDLFFATPARLKFLKSDSYESDNCQAVFNRIALAFRNIHFRFFDADREKYNYEKTDSLQKRISDIFGEAFVKNIFEINAENSELKLYGFIGVPTFNKAVSSHQFFFVNNRFVKDKIFASALKSAYSGLVPYGRQPVAIIFLEMPYNEVDVNAHPAKVEVRFREAEKIRFFLVSALKKALSSFGASVPIAAEPAHASSLNSDALSSSAPKPKSTILPWSNTDSGARTFSNVARTASGMQNHAKFFQANVVGTTSAAVGTTPGTIAATPIPEENIAASDLFITDDQIPQGRIYLGNALAQIGNTYIIAENGDDLIVVDQHAAAERITLEKLKQNLSLDSQNLLMPEVCNLTESEVEILQNNNDLLVKFGIYIEKLAPDLIVINSIPALLENCDAKSLVSDITEELSTFGDTYSIDEKINRLLSTISCHSSLRAGKKLTLQEMNHLLRRMEETLNIAQCCHGRPSYMVLSLKNLNKFFERS
jgi:DNA mismatch repair protein MutL